MIFAREYVIFVSYLTFVCDHNACIYYYLLNIVFILYFRLFFLIVSELNIIFAPHYYNIYNMNIKKIIRAKGFTLSEVASNMKKPNGEIGLPQSALSQLIINGNPTFDKLQEIAGIIGVSVSELVRDEDDQTNTIICPHCGKPIRFEKGGE